jgi:hypothetical protein
MPVDGKSYQCDEFPYWTTEQGGPDSIPLPDLQWVVGPNDHGNQGGAINGFRANCHMNGGYQPGDHGDAYLNIPLPVELGIPTMRLCNGH